jgi:hypothetical protein
MESFIVVKANIVLVTIVAWTFYQQIPDLPTIIGMMLIILGVIKMPSISPFILLGLKAGNNLFCRFQNKGS